MGEKLLSVLREKVWCWPPERFDNLVKIQSLLLEVRNIGELDQPIWNCSKKGQYSCSETWEAIRFKLPNLIWWKMIYMDSFYGWLLEMD